MDSSLSSWPEGLDTPLVERRHTIYPRASTVKMESGRRRVRRMQLEPIEILDVTWNFTADAYVTFRDFFINDLEHGSLFFVMETLEPTDELGQYILFTRSYAFLDGTYVFSESDNLFTVNASLEVDEEEQEDFPARHVDATVSDGATSSVTFDDGELAVEPELASISSGFLTGEHFLAVVFTPDQTDIGSSSAGFLDGVYLEIAVTISPTETALAPSGFLSGSYDLVVSIITPTETASAPSGFLSGSYTLIVVDTTQSETGSVSAGFLSGAYTLA